MLVLLLVVNFFIIISCVFMNYVVGMAPNCYEHFS